MIPRTTIDEANKHISQLHKKLFELEAQNREYQDALMAKDEVMKKQLHDLKLTKESDIAVLQEKLQSKERTVTILQEQMSQKNQQISALQKNIKTFKKVLSFKADLTEMVTTLNETENTLKNSAFIEDMYDDDTHTEGDSGIGTTLQYYSHLNGSTKAIDDSDHIYHSSRSSSRNQRRNSKGREFYL